MTELQVNVMVGSVVGNLVLGVALAVAISNAKEFYRLFLLWKKQCGEKSVAHNKWVDRALAAEKELRRVRADVVSALEPLDGEDDA